MVRSARAFYQQTFTASGTVVVREHTLRYPELDFAESLHPKLAFTNQIPLQVYGGNQHGRRQRVNASTALSFLKRREIVYQADRTTLVANKCGYEIRLDANEVVKQCNSVRIGILALTLLNGDTSILDPGVYSFLENQGDETSGFNRPFLSPYDTDPGLIEDYTMMKGYLQMPRVCKHALRGNLTEGLRLSAYTWKGEREIDFDRLKYESEEAFRQRENRARAHLSMGNRMNLARQEIFSLGYLAPDSIVWAGLDPDGIECRARLDAERVRRDPQMRQVVAEIFFGILLYLKTHSDADATGLANSFWQSVRVDTIDNTRDGLPDEVNDALFNHRAVLDAPFETLKLDTDLAIDRIMHNGALWIGNYERGPRFQPGLPETFQNALEQPTQPLETNQDLGEIGEGLEDNGQGSGEGSSTQQEQQQGLSFPDDLYYLPENPSPGAFENEIVQYGSGNTLLRRQ
ncbi:hypothetical protein GQ607_010808 [Colletotrichum asianum]|uniref:Uncharacterized protein n=1 Tax=Colletotrichum asianum TaxID=702518 RepID=A0A8H3W9A8_9PEZI|nr:hypothetical protein GQ607_010808 [Colletotrichum asianum]